MPRKLRKRDSQQAGHKWVDDNFDVKKQLLDNNGGFMPYTPAFTTAQSLCTEGWTETNPPDILFYLQPPPSQFEAFGAQAAVDEEGRSVMSPHMKNKEFRVIPILPERIAVDVPGWMMVAWRRIDTRITLQDIVDRMTTDLGDAHNLTDKHVSIPNKNILQNHCNRNCCQLLKYYHDYGRRHEPHRTEVEAVEGLTMNNIRYNTVLQVHPVYNRLVKVAFRRKHGDGVWYVEQMHVTEDNLDETTYPLDYFLFEGYNTDLSDGMFRAVMTLWSLQEKSVMHGKNPQSWRRLKKSCLPRSWFDRTRKKSNNKNKIIDCDICMWHSGEDDDQWKFKLETDFHSPKTQRKSTKAKVKLEVLKQTHGEAAATGEDVGFEHGYGIDTLFGRAEANGYQYVEDSDTNDLTPTSVKRKVLYRDGSPSKRRSPERRNLSQQLWQMVDSPKQYQEDIPANFIYNGLTSGAEDDPFQSHNGNQQSNIFSPASRSVYHSDMYHFSHSRAPHLRSDKDVTAEEFESYFASSFDDNIPKGSGNSDADGTQHLTLTYQSEGSYNSSASFNNDPAFFATEAGLDENDPEVAAMLNYARLLAVNSSPPAQPAIPATGIG